MDKYSQLSKIKKLYNTDNINIIKYLREETNENANTIEDILISYDFQAGTYIKDFYRDKQFAFDYLHRLSGILSELGKDCKSLLECGAGEGTKLVPLLNMTQHKFDMAAGIDISWSRVKYAQYFSKQEKCEGVEFAVADMFNLPCSDSSFDIIFTNGAIEPNGGKEKEILSELYRVCNRYLILIEPAYDFASDDAKKRMDEHGYVKKLYSSAKELGFKVITWELYGRNENELNPMGLMIVEKEKKEPTSGGWSCPVTKAKLSKFPDVYFSPDSLLAYPIAGGVPMLTRDNAIVATKFMDFYK